MAAAGCGLSCSLSITVATILWGCSCGVGRDVSSFEVGSVVISCEVGGVRAAQLWFVL
jgi:hypothetical protein